VAAALVGGHFLLLLAEDDMNRIPAVFLLLLNVFAAAQNRAASLSPAERSMASARSAVAAKPSQYSGYNQLAIALSRRARETSDPKYYAQAEDALKKSFDLSPGNLEGEKIHIWLLLGRHEFPTALEAAKALNKKVPDDVLVYGFLADANAELGNYADAERAVQWMLDLRPGNLPGLTRAAYLRELFGDVDGALELMKMAYEATPPTEAEDQAWILTQMGHLEAATGRFVEAEQLLQSAISVFPKYHYALANLATIRMEQKRYADAVSLLQQLYAEAPHAENLYPLAEALEKAGRVNEAHAAFVDFEQKSLSESSRKDNSSRELVFYYADHAHDPSKALQVAQQEYAWRHDVYTLDAYAWALHVNGKNPEARKQMETALAVGIKDAKLWRHAGEIALAQGDLISAERYLREADALHAPGSQLARATLASLSQLKARK
jgi:tetratricopeptide (TPR) repeat protein